MVKLTRIYTRGGDKGKTSLGRGERVANRLSGLAALEPPAAAAGRSTAHGHADERDGQYHHERDREKRRSGHGHDRNEGEQKHDHDEDGGGGDHAPVLPGNAALQPSFGPVSRGVETGLYDRETPGPAPAPTGRTPVAGFFGGRAREHPQSQDERQP